MTLAQADGILDRGWGMIRPTRAVVNQKSPSQIGLTENLKFHLGLCIIFDIMHLIIYANLHEHLPHELMLSIGLPDNNSFIVGSF